MQQQRIRLADAEVDDTRAADDADSVIDLRDQSVAEGLAELLSRFVGLTERATTAEARADREYEGRLAAAGRARSASHDLEFERAERQRLMVDNAELTREVELRREQLERINHEVDWFRRQIEDLVVSHRRETEELQRQLQESRSSLQQLQSLIGRRKRLLFERMQQGEQTSLGEYLLAPYRGPSPRP